MNHKNIRCVFIYKFVLPWIYKCTQLYNLDKAFHAISAVANKKAASVSESSFFFQSWE
ncbi:hypothetical protein M119_3385 [Bacteroides fragilis str. 3783N1-6]|uniref:Uncharacterized protein n=1 Tax=Bacteroides fragilis str. 3783N1-6 TaxID=1339310 RepID=A0AB73AHN8_BACFG|nr:hypothetical protein M118_3029 [Bacteroides fragilis str. 3783N1-2]EXZ77726.1 hypothetical protein M144_3279 [Bacteroides fragilis str. 3-F-2 \